MPLKKIEKHLLTDEKKKEYKTLCLSAIEKKVSSQKKTLNLTRQDKPGSDSRDNHRSEEMGKRFHAHLEKTEQGFRTGNISVRDYVQKYKELTQADMWPSVIVEITKGFSLERAGEKLEALGFYLADNGFEKNRIDKFRLFHMLHLHIPPDPSILSHMAQLKFSDRIFDAQRVHRLPRPGQPEKCDFTEQEPSLKDLVFPGGIPLGLETAGDDIVLCIADSGIDTLHPDLAGRIINEHDFTHEGDHNDLCGHGTHVAGIAAGNGRDSDGRYAGIASRSKLISAKIFDCKGTGTTQQILAGMRWAHDQGAHLINLSLGFQESITDGKALVTRACDKLHELGMVVCVSAGNRGPGQNTISVPGDSKHAICVAAVDYRNKTASFSSRGPTDAPERTGNKPDLAAFGVDIVSAKSRLCSYLPVNSGMPGYTALSGTSMSTPVVAGLCALLLSWAKQNGHSVSPHEIKKVLTEGAVKTGEGQGRGIVNGNKAFERLKQLVKREKIAMEGPNQEITSLGKYEVIKFLSKGGFGKVYKVFDPYLNETFIAKILHTPGESLERDLFEARIQRKLKHDAIVKVQDANVIEGKLCFIMEYVEGEDLQQRLDRVGPLPVGDAVRFVHEIAGALDYAHTTFDKPLLHYDLTPKNILLDQSDRVKLTDFGIARIMERPGNLMSRTMGTPNYMGPEQTMGTEDIHSEIWALGTIFYEMLTGRICFYGNSIPEILNKINYGKFQPLGEVNPDLPGSIVDIVHTMLRQNNGNDAQKRAGYDAMEDVMTALEGSGYLEKRYRSTGKAHKESGEKQAEALNEDDLYKGADPTLAENQNKRKKTSFLKLLAVLFVVLLTTAGGVIYADRENLIDLPPFHWNPWQQNQLPRELRNLEYEKQYARAMAADKNRKYHVAYQLFDNVERGADNLTLKSKAAYYKALTAALKIEDYHRAAKDFRLFLKKYPESSNRGEAHYYLGWIYLDYLKKPVKAKEQLKMSLHNNTNDDGATDYLFQKTEDLIIRMDKELKLKQTQGNESSFFPSTFSSIKERLQPQNRTSLILVLLEIIITFATLILWWELNHILNRRDQKRFRGKGPGVESIPGVDSNKGKIMWGFFITSIIIISCMIISNHLQIEKDRAEQNPIFQTVDQ